MGCCLALCFVEPGVPRDFIFADLLLFAMLALLLAPSALVPNSRPAVSSRRVALGEVSRFALGAAALAAGPLAAKADVASIAAAANVRNPLPTPCTARLPSRRAQPTVCTGRPRRPRSATRRCTARPPSRRCALRTPLARVRAPLGRV